MNVIQLDDERRRQLVQDRLRSDLLDDLNGKIEYHHELKNQRVLTQSPVFVRLREHTVEPDAEMLEKLKNYKANRGYRVIVAMSGEDNTPGVHFTLQRQNQPA